MTDHTSLSSSAAASEPLRPEVARANFHRFVFDVAWFGLALPATARFLPIYAIRLDASAALLGLLAALPAIVQLITSGLASRWRRRYPDSVAALFWPSLGFRLMFLLPALTPFFPPAWQPLWLVVAITLPALPQGVAGVLFLVLMREGVEPNQLPALTSRRSLIFNLTVAAGTLLLGAWLELVAFPFNYQMMFVAAFACSLVSMVMVLRVQPISAEPLPAPGQPVPRVWRDMTFRRVATVTALTHMGFFALVPVIPLRLVNDLGADEGFLSIFALFELAAAAITASQTARIVRRIGSTAAIALGITGTGLAALVLALAPSLPLTLVSGALSGAAWTLAAISVMNYFYENTPPDRLTPTTTAWNQVLMLSIFVGPLVGSQLASTSLGVPAVLLLGAAARVLIGAVCALEMGGGSLRHRRLALRRAVR